LSIRNRFERILTFVEVLLDGFTVALAVVGGYAVYHFLHLGKRVEYPFRIICLVALACAVVYVILLDREGAYQLGNSLLRIKETERSLRVSAQTFLLALPVTFFSSFLISRWVVVFAFLGVPVLQVMEKQLLFFTVCILRSHGFGIQKVLIYGAGYNGRRVFSALIRSPKLGLEPVIMTDDNPELAGQEVFEYAYRRDHSIRVSAEPITKELLDAYQCRFVIIAIPNLNSEKFDQVVAVAGAAKARLAFVPGHAADAEHWTEHADVDGILLSLVGRPVKEWYYETAKRPFDAVAALVSIVLLSPLLLVVSLLVRLDSHGPVLFRQQRVGRGGRLFDLFKFRTMKFDAPQYAFSPTDVDDPRITRLGRFLRRTSLDELPQLLNVLNGDMSLVGPRPEMPFIVEQYSAVHRQRLEVTPGITGLWQLSADRRYLIHQNIQYDLYYIRNRSFFMDLAILLHTLVFAMRGV
jgi:exopolysaccharide biosynthesis polyprenyl glycosylphosphotransferase